jgi:hypothetical protein
VYQNRTNKHSFEWTAYFLGLLLTVAFPLFQWVTMQTNLDHGVPKSMLAAHRAKKE